MSPQPNLQDELLRRGGLDQAARSAAASGGEAAFQQVMAIDDDNAAWLGEVVRRVGWPGRSMAGEDGAHMAWLLAQHADRHPRFQRRCLALLRRAVAAGEASPLDLAHLTDRVLLASGKAQIYGTQLVAREGRFVARRLRDPETVDERRAAAGLKPLQASLDEAHDLYGSPSPVPVQCRGCHKEIKVWLPEAGSRMKVECADCGAVMTLRLRYGAPAAESRARVRF
jgi:hypothetical protein